MPRTPFGSAIAAAVFALVCASSLNAQLTLSTNLAGTTTTSTGVMMFDITTQGNAVSIVRFDHKHNTAGNITVNVYYKVGTWSGFQTQASAWTLHDTVSAVCPAANSLTPVVLNTPLVLNAGTTYGIAIGATTGSSSYNSTVAASGYSDSNMTILAGCVSTGPFTGSITGREWAGTVYYQVGSNLPTLTPATGSGFTTQRVYTGNPGTALANADLVADSTVSSTLNITVTSSNPAPGVTAPPNQTGVSVPHTLSWTGTPSASGSFIYQVALSDGTNSASYNVTLTMTGAGIAYTFGATSVPDAGTHTLTTPLVAGAAHSLTYTITNTGNASLTLNNPASITNTTNCNVTITTQPAASVAASATTTTVLSVTPTSPGAFSFDYSLGNNAFGSLNPYNFTVSGTGSASGPLTVTLGNQLSGNAFPFNYSPANGRFQTAYSTTELASVAGRYITQIRVFGSSVSPVPQYGNLRLRLGYTTLATNALTGNFDTNLVAGSLVTVLGPVNYTPPQTAATGGAWYTFTFASPFLYNGTQNLVVDWSYDSRVNTGFTISSGTGRSRVYTGTAGGSALSSTGTPSTTGEYGIEFTYQAGAIDGTAIAQKTSADGTLALPATDKVAMDLIVSTVGSNRSLNALTFTKSGTITDAQVSSVSLVRDDNDNGVVDGTDTVLGTGTLASGSVTFSGSPLQAVTTTASVRLLLAVSIPSGPTLGATLGFNIASASAVSWSGGTDFNNYPIIATTLTYILPDMNVLRSGTPVADGGTDAGLTMVFGAANTLTYTIQSTGSAALVLSNPATIGSLVNCSVSITTAPASPVAPSASTTTVLSVTPTAAGAFSFTWSIGTNVPGAKNPYNFTVSGNAVPPMSGSYVINQAGGAGVDFTSIGAAFNALEARGVNGPVTLTITDSATYAADASYSLGCDDTGTAIRPVTGASATNTITLRAATGQTPKIQGSATGAVLIGQSATAALTGRGCLVINQSYVTVEGLEVFGGPNFGIMMQGNNISPFSLVTTDITIRRCKVRDIPDGPGIAFMGQNSAYFTNGIIEHNFVWNCFTNSGTPTTSGVLLDYTGGAITIRNAASGSGIVRHNTIVHTSPFGGLAITSNATGAIYAYSSSSIFPLNNVNNNIVVCTNATTAALFLRSATSNPTVANCNFNYWYSTVFLARAGSQVTFATWQTEGRDLQGSTNNPLLVSTSSPFDLHLQPSSPCINPTGQTSTATIDIDGDTRPQGASVDIGADEYMSAPVAPSITSAAPANGVVGTAYSHTFTATGSPTSFAWTIITGSLPPGLTLNASSGVLSGTPTSSGNYSFTVNCSNGVNPDATQNVSMTINQAPAITSSAPSAALLGAAYSHTFTASGFPATFTWSVIAGSLPAGLSLNASSGVLSGTPTASGAFNFTVQCANGVNPAATTAVSFVVNDPPFITSSVPAGGNVGVAYSHSYTASGYPTTFTWTVVSGTLPNGLTLNSSTGVLSGTPTVAGSFNGTVSCSNGIGADDTQAFSITISSSLQAPTITSGAPASALLGSSYSHTFQASGNPATFTWTVSAGTLPAGLSLNASSGVLSGTPTASGAFPFTVTCSNGVNPDATQNVTLNVNEAPAITSSAPAAGLFGAAYSHTFTASGFPASFTWSVISGALPAGLALGTSNGLLSGTPTTSGNFAFTVQCSNGVSPNATQAVNLVINRAPSITSSAPANGIVGAAYSHTFTAVGFPTSFTWSISAGSLPSGLSLNASSGLLSGTPTASGNFSFTVQCANGISPNATQSVNMAINQAPSVTSGAPAAGLFNTAYSHTFTASGFPATFTWSVSAGSLPSGLTLGASTGVLSGTPSASGVFNFTVQCANGVSPNATQAVSLTINRAPTITSGAPPAGVAGTAYSHTFTATAFPTTLTWSVISGSLPTGLALNAGTGVLNGTPTAGGTFNFTVQCANGISPDATQAVSLTVNQAPTITSPAPNAASLGAPYSHTFTASGFPTTFAWSVSAGTLPAGLSLNATTGELSGTPGTAGASTFTVTCSNGISPAATQNVNFNVTQGPAITSGAPPVGVVGTAYSHTFTASGFPASYTWSVSAGSLPGGLTLGASTGILSGTPTAAGAFAFTVTCSNGVAPDATQNVNLQINAAPTITSAALPAGATFTPYNHTCTATGMPAAFTWSVASGALPTGLTLNATTGQVSGTPTAAGTFTGTISCSNGVAPDATQAFNVVISATPAPDMAVSRGATAVADGGVDALGNTTITLGQTLTYTISNGGTAALNLTGTPSLVVTSGLTNVSGLVVTPPAATTVPVGGSVNFTISFTVPVVGAFSFQVSIDNSSPQAGRNPYNWTVSGTGVTAPEIDVLRGSTVILDGGAVALGNVTAGFASSFTFTISNSGNAPLTITNPVVLSNFVNCTATVTAPPAATVPAGGSTTFTVSVLGGVAGAYSFAVSITNNDADENPFDFTASGTAVAPGGSTVGGGGGGGGGGGCSTGEGAASAIGAMMLIASVSLRRRRKA